MSFRADWEALRARIDGLLNASRFFFETLPSVGSDYHAVATSQIIPTARDVLEDLNRFSQSYGALLPERAREALDTFLSQASGLAAPGTAAGIPGGQGVIVAFAVFRTEFDRMIYDAPTQARNLIVRAFVHLQRMIVADESARGLWQRAFEAGEPACEQLGSTHLLMHGIWAFTAVTAVSGLTDRTGSRRKIDIISPYRIVSVTKRTRTGELALEVIHDHRTLSAMVFDSI